MEKQRIEYLDHAKGILIILMVIGHIYQDTFISKFIYNFHMMAFFLISGMQFNFSRTLHMPLLKAIKTRIYTMMVPFCFFELWGCFSYIVRFGCNQNIKGFVYNTVTLNFNNGVQWFLFTLFFAELVFMALWKLSSRKWLLMVLSGILLGVSLFIPKSNNFLDYLTRILRAVSLLIMGYYSRSVFETKHWATAACCFVTVLMLTVLNGCIGFTDVSVKNWLLFLVGSFCGTYMVIQLGKLPWGVWMKYIGQNTLIIFATHNTYYMIFGKMLGVTDFRSISIGQGLIVLLFVAIVEIPTVYLLNRYLPFLVGKRIKKEL